jgi:Zn-dependent peptidase ImmA (M78 family)
MKKSINVLGAKVPIKYFDEKNVEENRMLMGYCQNSPLEIYINNSLTKIQKEHTLCHEIAHIVMTRVGLDQVLSAEVQEIICESFANFMHENMRFKK